MEPYIWKEMCTKYNESLTEAMCSADRIEAVNRRICSPEALKIKFVRDKSEKSGKSIDIGNINSRKLLVQSKKEDIK